MARSVVELLIAAKDATGDAFRSASKNLRAFAGEASKFAAGLGIFDSFKQLGKFVLNAAKDAAQAIPELGAPFVALENRWEKVRLEIGAGALQLGAPIAAFALNALDSFKDLVQGATEEWFKLPTRFDEVLGRIQQSLGEFLADTQVVLARLGVDTGDLGERIANAGAAKVRGAIRERGDLSREFATGGDAQSPVDRALAIRAAKEADDLQAKREQLLARIAATGHATRAELTELMTAEAHLRDQLHQTNLTTERRLELLDRQKSAEQALASAVAQSGVFAGPTGVVAAPPRVDGRRAEADRLAATEAQIQAEIAQGNVTIERQAELQARLVDLQARRFTLAKELDQLATNTTAQAEIHRQLEAGTLSLERQKELQKDLLALETQRAGLTQPRMELREFRSAADVVTPEQLAAEATAKREADLQRLAAAETALRGLLDEGNQSYERRAALEEQLRAIEAERARIVPTPASAPEATGEAPPDDSARLESLAQLTAREETLRAALAGTNVALEDRRALEEELRVIEAQRAGLTPPPPPPALNEAERIESLAHLTAQEAALRIALADTNTALEDRRALEVELQAIEAQKAALTPPPPPVMDPRPVELDLLSPEDRALIPAGTGDQAAEEVNIVREALTNLGLDLAKLTDDGWNRFGAAAASAAEKSVRAEGLSGKAALAAGKGAIGGLARAKSKDAFISAGKALADGLLGNPAAFASAAYYTAAGTGWAALAGEMGSGGGGGGSRGGGGGGGASGGTTDRLGRGLADQVGGTVVFKVPRQALVDPNNPIYQDMTVEALKKAGYRNIVFEAED